MIRFTSFLLLGVVLLVEFHGANSRVITLPLRSKSREMFEANLSLQQANDGSQQKRFYNQSPLYGCASNDFSVEVDIGTPQQALELIVQTSSTTLAVASIFCQNCGNGAQYSPGSSSAKTPGSINSTYADGSQWFADIYTDDVSIAGFQPVRMTFGAITTQSRFFGGQGCYAGIEDTSRGVIGFGYPALAVGSTDSYFDVLSADGQLDDDMFAIQMCSTTGTLWLGGYDPESMASALLYTPVIQQDYWVVQMSDLQVDGKSLGFTEIDFETAIVDSGTSLFTMPRPVFNALVSEITRSPNWNKFFPSNFFSGGLCYTVPGETPETMQRMFPPIDIILGDIPALQAIKLTLTPISSYLVLAYDGTNYFYCPGIGVSDNFSILGWSVMNQFTVVFDRSLDRVGFAVGQGCPRIGGVGMISANIFLVVLMILAVLF